MPVKLQKKQTQSATLTGDEMLAILVWYSGTAAGTMSWDGTTFKFFEDASADESVNTGGTNDGEITDTEAATFIDFINLVNADTDGNWHARLVGGFADGDTTDLLPVTVVAVTVAGITAGTGALNGGIAWDKGDQLQEIYLACLGPEMNTELANAAHRSSISTIRKTRDVADSDFDDPKTVVDTVARLFRIRATFGDAGTGPLTVLVKSADQDDTLALAKLKWSRVYVEDTEATDIFNPPADIESNLGERLVAYATSAANFDVLTSEIFGGYGDPGVLPGNL